MSEQLLPTFDVDAPAPHVMPKAVYYGVFGALIFFTLLTVFTASFDLGPFDIPVAMLIATIKATLVAAIFMHLWFDHKINVASSVFSLVCLSLFVMFCLIDLSSRHYVDPVKRNFSVHDEIVQDYKEKNPNAQVRAFKDSKPAIVEAKDLHDLDSAEGHH